MAELSNPAYIYFVAMSDLLYRFSYHDYKVAVYDNLFGGMVYGRGTRDSPFLVHFLSH